MPILYVAMDIGTIELKNRNNLFASGCLYCKPSISDPAILV